MPTSSCPVATSALTEHILGQGTEHLQAVALRQLERLRGARDDIGPVALRCGHQQPRHSAKTRLFECCRCSAMSSASRAQSMADENMPREMRLRAEEHPHRDPRIGIRPTGAGLRASRSRVRVGPRSGGSKPVQRLRAATSHSPCDPVDRRGSSASSAPVPPARIARATRWPRRISPRRSGLSPSRRRPEGGHRAGRATRRDRALVQSSRWRGSR